MASVMRLTARIVAAFTRIQEVLFFHSERSDASPVHRIAELSRSDLELIQSDPKRPWAGELGDASWFENGGRLYALEREGVYVSFGWAMTSNKFHVGEVGGVVRLARNVLWIWNCFTPPEYRGAGHYPTLLRGIRHALANPPTMIYCVRENRASRRGIMNAGFEDAFSIMRHRLFVVCRNNVSRLYAGYSPGKR